MKTKTHILCEYAENNITRTIEFDHVQKHMVHFPQAMRLLSKRGIAPDAIKYVETKADHRWTFETNDVVHICADCGKEFTTGEARDDHFMSPACKKHKTFDW